MPTKGATPMASRINGCIVAELIVMAQLSSRHGRRVRARTVTTSKKLASSGVSFKSLQHPNRRVIISDANSIWLGF